MSKAKKILGTEDAWETGKLGNDIEHAELASPEITQAVAETLAMQMISIRLPRTVIDTFKAIAEIEGIGYQPLMREALCRFAEGEAKRIVQDVAAKKRKDAARQEQDTDQDDPPRKVA